MFTICCRLISSKISLKRSPSSREWCILHVLSHVDSDSLFIDIHSVLYPKIKNSYSRISTSSNTDVFVASLTFYPEASVKPKGEKRRIWERWRWGWNKIEGSRAVWSRRGSILSDLLGVWVLLGWGTGGPIISVITQPCLLILVD